MQKRLQKTGLYTFRFDGKSNAFAVDMAITGIFSKYYKQIFDNLFKISGLDEVQFEFPCGIVISQNNLVMPISTIVLDVKKGESASELFVRYYEELVSECRQCYLKTCKNISLDSLLSNDYSLGYSKIFPIKDDIKKLLEIGIEAPDIMKEALKARYNYVLPSFKNKADTYGYYSLSRDAIEKQNELKNDHWIMNFLQELVENKIIFDGKTINTKQVVSKEEIINECMPVIEAMMGTERFNKNSLMQAITKFCTWSGETSQSSKEPSYFN